MSVPATHPKKLLFVHYDKQNERIIEPLKLSATVAIPNQPFTLTGAAGSAFPTLLVNLILSRDQDNVVTLTYSSLNALSSNAANMSFDEVLPLAFRPSQTLNFRIPISDNGLFTAGTLGITLAGVVTIGIDGFPAFPFTNATFGGVQASAISYHI